MKYSQVFEIFTGFYDDEDGILLPRSITKGFIIKSREDEETSRLRFSIHQFAWLQNNN